MSNEQDDKVLLEKTLDRAFRGFYTVAPEALLRVLRAWDTEVDDALVRLALDYTVVMETLGYDPGEPEPTSPASAFIKVLACLPEFISLARKGRPARLTLYLEDGRSLPLVMLEVALVLITARAMSSPN